ncbi:MAG: hypothetical protein KZQ74_04380, partial [gamma proteobacterium symbiont of Bathyaustriella thionipta]|nr:hypothetical protein [gamma proteobacterium symbiont of Bathyaustriella thionipta]
MTSDTPTKKVEKNQKGKYKVVFKGRLLPGYDIEQVVSNIVQLTKLPPEKIEKKFFNGKVVIIRRAHDRSHAQKLQHLFTEAGLEVLILTDVDDELIQQNELALQQFFIENKKAMSISAAIFVVLILTGLLFGMDLSYLVVIGVFLAYFVLHTLTASISMKQWVAERWPEIMPWYRLAFNALAIILLIPLLVVMFYFPGEPLWSWHGMGFYLTSALAVAAFIGFFYSLKYYDLSEFWGTRQLKE